MSLLFEVPICISANEQAEPRSESPGLAETTVRATVLANLIDDLAGRNVSVGGARVVGVLSPRVFLIEPATTFSMMLGARDRIAVLIAGNAALRVDAATLVGSTVTVSGVARTALGLTVSRDVPWPPEFTRDYLRKLEVRAALLATSVRSLDGVELTAGMLPSSTASPAR